MLVCVYSLVVLRERINMHARSINSIRNRSRRISDANTFSHRHYSISYLNHAIDALASDATDRVMHSRHLSLLLFFIINLIRSLLYVATSMFARDALWVQFTCEISYVPARNYVMYRAREMSGPEFSR